MTPPVEPAFHSCAPSIIGETIAVLGIACAFAIVVSMGAVSPAIAQSEPWDPVFRTILAGSAEDTIRGTAIDADGNFYVTGGSGSSDFPTTPGAYDRSLDQSSSGVAFGPHDVVVAKYSPSGQLLWSTFLGGRGYDRAYSVEVDATGVYVAGRAGAGYPTTPGSVQPGFAGDFAPNGAYGPQDGFVTKLSLDGSSVIWSTYFGGPGSGFIRDIALDGSGQVHLALATVSGDNPHITPGALQTVRPSDSSGVVAKLSADGGTVLWATYLGGSAKNFLHPALRVGRFGEVYVVGETESSDFPVTQGAFQTSLRGPSDLTLTAISADGSARLFATYLGGSAGEECETHCIALGPDDSIYVTATTASWDFPTTPGAFQSSGSATPNNAFVMRFGPDGTLAQSTIFGGDGNDSGEGIEIDPLGDVMLGGNTFSQDLPLAASPYQVNKDGSADFYVAVLSHDLGQLHYATYLGGPGYDTAGTISVASDGTILTGGTVAGSFDTSDGTQYSNAVGNDYPRTASDAVAVVFRVPEPSLVALQSTSLLTLIAIHRLRRRTRRA